MESGKQCSICNKVNSEEANFCMSCGANLYDKRKQCSTCNEVNSEEANFCISCGANLSDTKNIATVNWSEDLNNPRVIELKQKLFNGSYITIEDCRLLYCAFQWSSDPTEREEVYKAIWIYLVGKKLCPELNVEKNWETPIVHDYINFIIDLVGDYVSDDCIRGIPDYFVKDAINSSESLDALFILCSNFDWWSSSFEGYQGWDRDDADEYYSKQKMNEIINLANKRYSKIKKKWWQLS